MSSKGVVLLSLMLFLVMTISFYGSFNQTFSDEKILEYKISKIKNEQEKLKLDLAVKDYQIEEYALKFSGGQRLPASQQASHKVSALANELMPDLLFEKIKKQHARSECNELIINAQKFSQTYSYSAQYPEVMLLLADCYFQVQKTPETLNVLSDLLDHYPDHKVTPFALFKMAEIFNKLGRYQEQNEVLNAIVINFKEPEELINKAQEELLKIEAKL